MIFSLTSGPNLGMPMPLVAGSNRPQYCLCSREPADGSAYFQFPGIGNIHARTRRTAAAARRKRLIRARKFRSRRRKGEGRGAEGAADADVRGAQRHQRSDHAGEDPANELFELVCEAAVLGGTFTSATIALAEPGEEFLRIAAIKGPKPASARARAPASHHRRPSRRPRIDRNGVPHGSACIINDFLADQRTAHWHELAQGTAEPGPAPAFRC